jgi:metal-responsive CopG/Arc/MetJ family transcriptional regulator
MGPQGRPKKDAVMDTLAVRLPDDLVQQIDEYVGVIKSEFPRLNVTRADAVRQLLAAGIDAEKERLARRKG